jgi:addiction module RelE/StbE family toxin
MSHPFDIRYLKAAEDDFIDIFQYIKKDNPAAAVSQLEKFDTVLSHLAQNPLMGTVPKDKRLKKLGYRMLIVDPYLVFYVVKPEVVQIRRIIHGARRYDFLL